MLSSTLRSRARGRASTPTTRVGLRLPLLALLLLVGAPPQARANLRAPRRLPQDGSSALYPTPFAEVQGEQLHFVCKRDACLISARYTVRSQQAQQVELSFIVPGAARVSAKVAGKPVSTQLIVAEALEPREQASLSLDTRGDSLHKATFQAALAAGENLIEVSYLQRGDGVERDYGYFSEGSFVYQLRYELWPLKEWTLASDFKLTLQVEYQRDKPPSSLKRWFGSFDTIVCKSEHDKRMGARASRSERTASFQLELTAATMPDRLICSMGREKLVDLPE